MKKTLIIIILMIFWIFGCSSRTVPKRGPSSASATRMDGYKTSQAKTVKVVKVQCRAMDKNGKRCHRKTTDPSGYCKKHEKSKLRLL